MLDLSMPTMDGFEACRQIFDYYSEENKILGNAKLDMLSRFEHFKQSFKDQ